MNDLGYNHMFTEMFDCIEKGTEPRETFYDGYIVNAILDAAYKSAKTKQWEPVELAVARQRRPYQRQPLSGIRYRSLPHKRRDDTLWRKESDHQNKHSGKIEEKILE